VGLRSVDRIMSWLLGIDNLIYAFIFADEDEDSGLREAGQVI
jgi:hypothetical protein